MIEIRTALLLVLRNVVLADGGLLAGVLIAVRRFPTTGQLLACTTAITLGSVASVATKHLRKR